MSKTGVKKSEMTIGLYLCKAAQVMKQAESALWEAEELAHRTRNIGHPQAAATFTKVSGLHERVIDLREELEQAAY